MKWGKVGKFGEEVEWVGEIGEQEQEKGAVSAVDGHLNGVRIKALYYVSW